jgi:hypothetical protein
MSATPYARASILVLEVTTVSSPSFDLTRAIAASLSVAATMKRRRLTSSPSLKTFHDPTRSGDSLVHVEHLKDSADEY